MAITWDQLPLTASQQQLMKDLATWNQQENRGAPPTTYSQSKQAANWHNDLNSLVQPARNGAREAIEYFQRQAVRDYDTSNP